MSIRSISLLSFLVVGFSVGCSVGCSTVPTIEPDVVARAIRFRTRDFMACFEENYNRPTEGRYRLSFTIGNDGNAYTISPDREAQTLPVVTLFDDCMAGVLRETAFPVPANTDEVRVNYPFYFSWTKEKPKAPEGDSNPAPEPKKSP